MMRLVGVRSSAPDGRLVAVLVEDSGSRVLAVPVSARQGLRLSAGHESVPSSWAALLQSCLTACGWELVDVEIDVDQDARLDARLRLRLEAGPADGGAPRTRQVHCSPGEGLVLASEGGLPVLASEDAVRLRAIDLAAEGAGRHFSGWREVLDRTRDTRG